MIKIIEDSAEDFINRISDECKKHPDGLEILSFYSKKDKFYVDPNTFKKIPEGINYKKFGALLKKL